MTTATRETLTAAQEAKQLVEAWLERRPDGLSVGLLIMALTSLDYVISDLKGGSRPKEAGR